MSIFVFFVTLLQRTRAPHNGLWRRRDAGLLLWRQSPAREFFKLKGARRKKLSGRWRTSYHHPRTALTSGQDLLLPHTIKPCYCVTGYWYVTKHEGTDLNEQEGSCLDTCVCVCVSRVPPDVISILCCVPAGPGDSGPVFLSSSVSHDQGVRGEVQSWRLQRADLHKGTPSPPQTQRSVAVNCGP